MCSGWLRPWPSGTDIHEHGIKISGSHGLNGLRISLSVFNNESQVDVLVTALRELVESE